MKIYKSKWFARFAEKEHLSDALLCDVVKNIEQGMIDADYGGGVIKQRIARTGKGKSGGYRSVIYYKKGERTFFVYGFAKNKQENINVREVKDMKEQAKVMLTVPDKNILKLIENGTYQEVIVYDTNI